MKSATVKLLSQTHFRESLILLLLCHSGRGRARVQDGAEKRSEIEMTYVPHRVGAFFFLGTMGVFGRQRRVEF